MLDLVNQGNYFENTNTCRKCMLKMTVATQFKTLKHVPQMLPQTHALVKTFLINVTLFPFPPQNDVVCSVCL
jgi:hypothetical protein